MDFILINRDSRQTRPQPIQQAEHPELDQPEGDLSWEKWLEGRHRLETTLLITAR